MSTSDNRVPNCRCDYLAMLDQHLLVFPDTAIARISSVLVKSPGVRCLH